MDLHRRRNVQSNNPIHVRQLCLKLPQKETNSNIYSTCLKVAISNWALNGSYNGVKTETITAQFMMNNYGLVMTNLVHLNIALNVLQEIVFLLTVNQTGQIGKIPVNSWWNIRYIVHQNYILYVCRYLCKHAWYRFITCKLHLLTVVVSNYPWNTEKEHNRTQGIPSNLFDVTSSKPRNV